MKYNLLRKSFALFALLLLGVQAVLAQFTATGRVTDKAGSGLIDDVWVKFPRPANEE